MSSIQFLFALCLLTLVSNTQAQGWKGNYGSRTVCSYRRVWQCAYRTWRACCYYKWVTVPYYYTQYFCLPGWKEGSPGSNNCDTAICNPDCQNGGTCTLPNKCTCTGAFSGPTCQGKLCSHLKPCYPGSCTKFGSGSKCTCSDGFRDLGNERECLTLVSPKQRPEIYQCRLRISQFSTTRQMEKWGVMLDASYNNDTDTEEIWTNRKGFNLFNYTGIAFYDPVDLPPVPSDYISDVKLGIIGGSFNTVHIKLGGRIVPFPNEAACDDTGVNRDKPMSGIFNCTIKNHKNILLSESGDRINITFTALAGGYRQLKDIDSGANYRKQYYIQTNMSKTLTYRFDFDKPTHCFPTCNGEEVLEFGAEYRQDPTLSLKWNGWNDTLSGVARYAWEIFQLKANGDEELREPVPLGPIKIAEVNHSENIDYPKYTLPEPGLYSIILQVADTANNSVYVRRFCLYDPDSTIQLSDDPNTRLRVASASPESNFTWQGNMDGIIKVNWTNYFFNEFLEQNHLLNNILDYPDQFRDEDLSEQKHIDEKYKNIAGRTQQAVPNTRGITKFQIGHHHDSNGGKNKPTEPNVWNALTDPISTTHALSISVSNGDTVVVYVKAIDATGRERVDWTQVNFDSTPPVVTKLDFEITPDKTSSLSAAARDPDSGVLLISWRAVRLDTNTEYATGQLFWSSINTECGDVIRCMCIAKFDQCFQLATQLSFDNCQIALAGLSNSVTVELRFSVMNQAKVGSEEKVYKISDIREVSDVCLGPAGLSGGAVAGISIGVILLIIIAVLIVLFLTNQQPFTKRRKERGTVYIRNMIGKSTATNQHTASPSSSYPNNAYRADEDEVYYYGGMDFQKGQSWQIPHDHLALLGTITEGKFAKICQARIRSRSEQVVAKMLKDGYTSEDEVFMRAKVNFYATVVGKDPNILEFVGAVVDNEVLGPVLVLEYCELGQLDKWLLKQRGDVSDDTIEILQRIAFDVSKGMAYLASKKIVHKKLAARNVLLTFTREAKVAGFGPSRPEEGTPNDYDNASNVKKERIPIKWTAPECLVSLKDANEKSDVWSYGIVLWEIFSLGETPYNDMKSREVETKVKSGYRMPKPEICEDFHYDLMKNCWEENPKKRHSFKTIKTHIAKTFSANTRDSVYYYK